MANVNPFTSDLAAVPGRVMQNAFIAWQMDAIASDDYSAYRYEYKFKRDGDKSGAEKTVAVDANGRVELTTTNWPAGNYRYSLYLVRQSDQARAYIGTGVMTVSPDPSTGVDGRTHAEIMLAKIESLIEGRADSDVESYTIAGRQITKMKMSELVSWRAHYQNEVASQRRADAGSGSGGYIRVRFT